MGGLSEGHYRELAARMANSDRPVGPPRDVSVGDEAAAAGRDFLVQEYGSIEAVDEIVRGRPKVGSAKRGPSPTVRGRIPESDHTAFTKLMAATGRSESALVREAVHELLRRNQDKIRSS